MAIDLTEELTMTRYDVVTLGETMLRLTPPNLRRLEQTAHLDVEVGGTESNLAIGLARLGLKSLWLSRLTANSLGRLICNAIAAHGVDTSRIAWTDEDRVGILFWLNMDSRELSHLSLSWPISTSLGD